MNEEKTKSTGQLATTTTMKYGDDFEKVATLFKERKEKTKQKEENVLSPGWNRWPPGIPPPDTQSPEVGVCDIWYLTLTLILSFWLPLSLSYLNETGHCLCLCFCICLWICLCVYLFVYVCICFVFALFSHLAALEEAGLQLEMKPNHPVAKLHFSAEGMRDL